MKTTVKIAIILAVVFCLILVQSAISGPPDHAGQLEPIWKIFQDGTDQSVPWVDAENPRFAVYDGMVLDKETGLLWDQSNTVWDPEPGDHINWIRAFEHCMKKNQGNRRGWRLPTLEEMASLIDTRNEPALPSGHPFDIESPADPDPSLSHVTVWTSSHTPWGDGGDVTTYIIRLDGGVAARVERYMSAATVMCVRGGHGPEIKVY